MEFPDNKNKKVCVGGFFGIFSSGHFHENFRAKIFTDFSSGSENLLQAGCFAKGTFAGHLPPETLERLHRQQQEPWLGNEEMGPLSRAASETHISEL